MGPIDYSTQVQQPIQAAAQGYAFGAGIRDDQQHQQQLAQQQQAQLQMQRDVAAVTANPDATGEDYGRLMTKYPSLADPMTKAFAARNSAQQQAHVSDLSQWTAAIDQGQPKVASDSMRARADAIDNSAGGPTSKSQYLRTQADVIDAHPEFASRQMKVMLAATGDQGLKVLDQLRTLPNDPANSKKLTADADLARTQADVAAGTAPAKIVEATLTNDKTLQDIAASKLTGRVAELNTQIGQANSETERGKLTLERDKLVQQQQQQKQAQGQAAQEGMDASTQALTTLQQIKAHPGLDDYFTGPGSKLGPMAAKIPGSDRNALQGWVDSLKSQLSYSALQASKASSPNGSSGFGALSEGEVKLLSQIAGNLDLNSADFPKQLTSVERMLTKAQSTATASGKLPTTGGAFVVSSPKYGDIKESDINRLMIAHPGTTREQVLQFFQGAQ